MLDLVELLEWLDNAGITIDPQVAETKLHKVTCDYGQDHAVRVTIETKPNVVPWPTNVHDCHLHWCMED